MKLTLEDVKAIGGYRYQQKRDKESSKGVFWGTISFVVGAILALVALDTGIQPDIGHIATYAIIEPGQLVITDGDVVRFNDGQLPVVYSDSTKKADVSDWVLLGIGGVMAIGGLILVFGNVRFLNDRRHAFADEFAQKWLDTGELPSKDKDEA
jgi:hypothetical protein